jgi:Ca2+/Na+ antiporter
MNDKKNKKTPNFFLVIIVLILGQVLFEKFDFENLKFEKPALAILYIVVFVFSIYFLIRDYKNRPKK